MSDLVISNLLKDILDDKRIIDITIYNLDRNDKYCGKVLTVNLNTIECEHISLHEMLMELHNKINAFFNADTN